MRHPHAGRHEHGQNFLRHRPTIDRVVSLVADTRGPIVEIGPGDGAITLALERLGRPLTAVEIDRRRAARLADRAAPTTTVVAHDFLRYRWAAEPQVLVGNLPFHLTTALLRKILAAPHWTEAVLLVQWEVARRRAGVGGTSVMTVQSAPWFTFALDRRVPAHRFHPRPSVDGGLLVVRRRAEPLVGAEDRQAYRDLVHRVFTGRGRGMAQIVGRACEGASVQGARMWLARRGLLADSLPRDLAAGDWADLFHTFGRQPGRLDE